MKLKALLSAVVLAGLPTLALACPSKEARNMSCADGSVWDSALKTCVKQISS